MGLGEKTAIFFSIITGASVQQHLEAIREDTLSALLLPRALETPRFFCWRLWHWQYRWRGRRYCKKKYDVAWITGNITRLVGKYPFSRLWVLLTEQTLTVIKKHTVIQATWQYPAQHDRCKSSLMLRMTACGDRTNMLPVVEQNRGCQVLRKNCTKEQTKDQFVVLENTNTHKGRDTELFSVLQTELSHLATVFWHLTSLMLHRLGALKPPSLKTRPLLN